MLEHLFGSKTRLKLLQIFFKNQNSNFFMRELSRLSGTQLNAIRREIINLKDLGIIKEVGKDEEGSKRQGTERSKFFRIDEGGLMFSELQALLLKARVLDERKFIEEVKSKSGDIKMFLLTGFFVDDKEAETDIFLVGNVKERNLDKIIKNFEDVLGESIRYTVMSEKEFLERRDIGDKFIYSIFESKFISIVDQFNLT